MSRISAKRPVLRIIHLTRNISMMGIVKRKNEKGFGFITPEGADKDVFFHTSSLMGLSFDELQEGDKVSFDTEESDKGPRAVNVQRA